MIKPFPAEDSAAEEIRFERIGRLGVVTLDRPRALNALTLGMIRRLDPMLAEWAHDHAVDAVVEREIQVAARFAHLLVQPLDGFLDVALQIFGAHASTLRLFCFRSNKLFGLGTQRLHR